MKITLVHPPLDDPTIPYHSTAYLAGHLIHSGFRDVNLRDLNIEFVNWCMEEEVINGFHEEAERRLRSFEERDSLEFFEQEEYLNLWTQPAMSFSKLTRAAQGLREKETFLDFLEYRKNIGILLRHFRLLGALGFPSEVTNFRQNTRGRYSLYNLRDLFDADLARRACYAFDCYLEQRLANDEALAQTDCLGISIVYDHQLLHTLHLARWFKRRWPGKPVLLGGTSISQLYKYMKDPQQMKRFFACCDGIVVGEGETAICQIADAGGVVPGGEACNLITYDAVHDRLHLPRFIHYENVPALGRPVFQHDWNLYLSPERGFNYAPTRGCYWNRCTFCDYGLNTEKPTSPWRERRIDQVIDDLEVSTRETGARHVYFAVDVMSPAYLERLSDAICDAQLDIRWSAELRMEKVFSPERCAKIRQSGCVCVSFGMESGSQRILDLIDKGTKVEYMGETMKNFAREGIAVQLMAFKDFPTETPAEKEATKRFVEEHKDYWAAGGLGTFLLTGTAIVAKDPARFGVRLIETQDADIGRALAYDLEGDKERDQEEEAMLTEDRDASFDSAGDIFPLVLGRPWAGGTDSLHTMIYYERYDPMFFRDFPAEVLPSREGEDPSEILRCRISLPGAVRESPFDIREIAARRGEFVKHFNALKKIPREPTLAAYQECAGAIDAISRGSALRCWVWADQECVVLDKLIFRLLKAGAATGAPLGDLLRGLDQGLSARILTFLRSLEQHALVKLESPQAESLPAGSAFLAAGALSTSASQFDRRNAT